MTPEIIQSQHTYNLLMNQLSFHKKKWSLFRFFKIKSLNNKIEAIQSVRKKLIDEYLSIENSEYTELVQRNYSLLKIDELRYNVSHIRTTFFGNYSKSFEGKIFPNGHSYCDSYRTGLALFPFDGFLHPSKIKGKVNHWGDVDLQTVESDYGIRNMPKNFVGKVGDHGNIVLEVRDLKFAQRQWVIGTMIGNHFGYDETKNISFQNNIIRMQELIDNQVNLLF